MPLLSTWSTPLSRKSHSPKNKYFIKNPLIEYSHPIIVQERMLFRRLVPELNRPMRRQYMHKRRSMRWQQEPLHLYLCMPVRLHRSQLWDQPGPMFEFKLYERW